MVGRFSLQTLLGLLLPFVVYFAWPSGSSYSPLIIALAWAWLLLGPWPGGTVAPSIHPAVISSTLFQRFLFAIVLLFVLICLGHQFCGNYLLWLKSCFYLAFSCRFALLLYEPYEGKYWLKVFWLCCWSICALASLLWTAETIGLYLPYLVSAILLWSAFCTLWLLCLPRRSAHKLVLALLHLGPLPPLVLAWPDLACWVLAPLAAILALWRWSQKNTVAPDTSVASEERGRLWVPLWLFRTAYLSWWGIGGALSISLAWWLPGHDFYFEHNAWLKALSLGLFVLVCLGLLLEYLMPLLGRPEPEGHWRRDQSWGPMLSALALMIAMTPALLLPMRANLDLSYLDRVKEVLLDEPVLLGASRAEIELPLPDGLGDISRVYVESRLINGQNVVQGQPVALMAVMGESGLPAVYYIRAGIDTAEESLERSRVMALAMHGSAEVAGQQIVFSPEGQAYYQHIYWGGFFLQEMPETAQSISLHYMPISSPFEEDGTPYLVVEKVMVE